MAGSKWPAGSPPDSRHATGVIVRVGTLDISFHRDDIGRHPIPKEFAPTQIPGDVNGADVILVDDVLFSGRTVKAALDELFDHGRPTKVELAVLVDRGGRRLPLAAGLRGHRSRHARDGEGRRVRSTRKIRTVIRSGSSRRLRSKRALSDLTTPHLSLMPWNRRHLLTIEELSLAEIEQIHATAVAFKRTLKRSVKKVPALRGKTIVNLFLEPSTRTRMAFDMAAKRLSADVISLDAASSSTTKGETLRDTAENIQALQADMIVIRHAAAGSPLYLSRILGIPVINAGDGAHEHPTQGLLDTFTMKEHLGSLRGRKVVILGDILFSRVARSNIHALTKMGAAVTLVGPVDARAALVHRDGREGFARSARRAGRCRSCDAAADSARAAVSRHFPSLGEYTSMFGLNKTRASLAESEGDHHASRPDQSRRRNRQRTG